MPNLDKWEKSQLTAGFNLLDLNKDGKITLDELQKALSACGFKYSDEEMKDMIRVVDPNHKSDGSVSQNQFLNLFNHQTTEQTQNEIRKAFNFISGGEENLSTNDLNR
eukprot:UN02757